VALKDPKPHQDEDEALPLPSGYWDDPELERLWAEEAERRYQDYLEGKEEAVPGEEAIRRIRATRR
jgi:hypothetical protein